MSILKEPVELATAFGLYTVNEIIGEGGAGRVYAGTGDDGTQVAIKVLSDTSSKKRARFKNEIAFLSQNKHPNIVSVVDHGVANTKKIVGPFYVMRRYQGNLRGVMGRGIAANDVLPLFSKILDGVEAAHFYGVVHRDLKPENILYDVNHSIAIADFGIASFTEDILHTLVNSSEAERLANFQYAAPEQRVKSSKVTIAADIYALGLILNEMFTGVVPHGTEYRQIGSLAKGLEFLDPIVGAMLRQDPRGRPVSIESLKGLIQKHRVEAVSIQRLSQLAATVIKAGEIDDPLAFDPPQLVGAEWNNGILELGLDRRVTHRWVSALRNMGSFTSVEGRGPEAFTFDGLRATVHAREHEVQQIINYFKGWLTQATRQLKFELENEAKENEARRREQLRQERAAEEQRLRINQSIKI